MIMTIHDIRIGTAIYSSIDESHCFGLYPIEFEISDFKMVENNN